MCVSQPCLFVCVLQLTDSQVASFAFEVGSSKASKYIWKCCVDNIAFYTYAMIFHVVFNNLYTLLNCAVRMTNKVMPCPNLVRHDLLEHQVADILGRILETWEPMVDCWVTRETVTHDCKPLYAVGS